MDSRTNRGSKVAIVGIATSIVMLVWAYSLVQVQDERRQAVAAGIRENINRSVALEQYVARTLEGADLATAYVADRYADLLERRRGQARALLTVPLADFARRAPALREINVISAQGDLVATSVTTRPGPVNVFQTAIFQQHRSDPSTALRVNPVARSRLLPDWFLLLSRRVNRADGSFGGTVSVQIRPSELTNYLENASLRDTDTVSVIGFDGITRARRAGDVLSFGQNLRETLVMRMQQRHPDGTYLGPSAIDGLVRYFSHRRLPRYGIFVTSGVSRAALLRPVYASARNYVLGASLISLITVVATWLVLARLRRQIAREAEIVGANTRLREAQRLARLGDWSFDLEREEFLWSGDLCTMYERGNSQVRVGLRDFRGIVGQHGMETFRFALQQLQASGEMQEYELAARLPGGAISHRRVVAVADRDASGRLIGVHGTDQDITPRKLLESLQEQVGHLSRIDGLNAIAATLAHELTQPLTAASNYLSGSIQRLSSDGVVDKPAVAEALHAVRTQIIHAGEIIRRVRNLVSNREARMETITLEDVMNSAVTLSEAVAPGSVVTILTQPGCQNAKVLADPVQLQQILVNLIRNARDASRPREPSISIETRYPGNGFAEICVIDDGPGMTNGGRDVFSPFAASSSSGLGVGLAICRTLIESMGGRIWIPEAGSIGTTICLSLPEA